MCRVGLLSAINLLITQRGDYPVILKTVTGESENEFDKTYMPASPEKTALVLGLSLGQQRASRNTTLNKLVSLLYKVVRIWAFNAVVVCKVIPRA